MQAAWRATTCSVGSRNTVATPWPQRRRIVAASSPQHRRSVTGERVSVAKQTCIVPARRWSARGRRRGATAQSSHADRAQSAGRPRGERVAAVERRDGASVVGKKARRVKRREAQEVITPVAGRDSGRGFSGPRGPGGGAPYDRDHFRTALRTLSGRLNTQVGFPSSGRAFPGFRTLRNLAPSGYPPART